MPSNDPITAIVEQLAAHAEQLTRLDRTLQEHAATVARLTTACPAGTEADGYHPGPVPAWWKLPAAERQEPIARLQAWVEQVYRPGYGHLAAGLGPCWPSHDLCLYGLDILSELWSVLYLQEDRSAALLSAQAEYQARILPVLADQLRVETSRCGHPRSSAISDLLRSTP